MACEEDEVLLDLSRVGGSAVWSKPYEDRCPTARSLASNHSWCNSGSMSRTSSLGSLSPEWPLLAVEELL